MILKSNGIHERDFIGITQICQTIELLVFDDHESKQSNLYNLGSGEAQSVMSMAELIQQRCSKILGFKPIISFTEVATDAKNSKSKLTYRIDRLAALGINFKSEEKADEIDNLLRFCHSNFVQKNNIDA